MNILVVSKIFYPSNRIGAVRPTNLAKYLAKFGHKVTVITAESESENKVQLKEVNIIRISNSSYITRIIQMNNTRIFKKTSKKNPNNPPCVYSNKSFFSIKLTDHLKKIANEFIELVIEIDWYINAIRKLKIEFVNKKFDVTFSTYGPLSSFLVGRYTKKKNISKYWISDFRDNMKSSNYSFFLNKLYNIFEKSALRNADLLTFVSIGQKFIFLRNNYVKNKNIQAHILYNGYEKNNFTENNSEDGILNLVYTGQLYYKKSDFSMLFLVIDELISECKIDCRYIKIKYAGQSSEYFNHQVNNYNYVKNICECYGYVTKEKSLELQNQSDILLVFAWNTIEEQGILTGKFVEYLSNNKPIISLTSGNKPNGELTQMVYNMNLGIACEYCNYEFDKKRLKDYILKQYNLKLNGQNLQFNASLDKIKEFDYEHITNNLLNLIANKLPDINN